MLRQAGAQVRVFRLIPTDLGDTYEEALYVGDGRVDGGVPNGGVPNGGVPDPKTELLTDPNDNIENVDDAEKKF